jgi:hypothetical protein
LTILSDIALILAIKLFWNVIWAIETRTLSAYFSPTILAKTKKNKAQVLIVGV